jgi:perosamine synthetase
METPTRRTNASPAKDRKKTFYHLPPTAVPVRGSDFSYAIKALVDPVGTLDNFISTLVEKTGNPNCYLTSSGRSALAVILLTLKKSSNRSKVILPAYTCPTVAQAVLWAGLQPVFCDVSPTTLDMDRNSLHELLDQQVLAVIPTHLYGLAQDISDLVQIGRESEIYIIEDAAQAFGASINNQMVGNAGDFGFYSLGRGKCIPTGHGGIIVTSDLFVPNLIETIQATIQSGLKRDPASLVTYLAYGLATTPFGWWFIFRSPMNPAQDGMQIESLPPLICESFSVSKAGIGLSILKRIDQINALRRENAHRLIAFLANFEYVQIPKTPPESVPVFLRFPIILDQKIHTDLLYNRLSQAGIGVSRSYIRTLPDIFSCYHSADSKKFTGANHLAECLLTLPTHPYLKDDDFVRIEHVFESINT